MIAEQLLVKRYLGARFGYAEPIPNGVYAIPCDAPKGDAFIKFTCLEHGGDPKDNFTLFWDEKLEHPYEKSDVKLIKRESGFSFQFRKLMKQI